MCWIERLRAGCAGGAAAALGAALLAAGCGPLPAPTSPPAGTPDRGTPAFQRVLDRIDADGRIDRDVALQAFALAFGPPPGVQTPPGPSEPILSGSGALRWVIGHWGELTPAQQRAVSAVIPRPSRRSAARADGLLLVASNDQARFDAMKNTAWAYWSRTLPAGSLAHPLDAAASSVILNLKHEEGDAAAYAVTINAQGGFTGPGAECDIYINPEARSYTDNLARVIMYHEVLHCFQAQMVGDLADYYLPDGVGSWLIEGGAAWGAGHAMATEAGLGLTSAYDATFWPPYFRTPTTPLFQRSYDAIGFFAHLAESGIDVIGRTAAAIRALGSSQGGNVAAFDAFFAGASPDKFFATWPTSLLRKPALGPEWDTHDPTITRDATVPANVAAGSGSPPAGALVPAYANDDRRLTVGADVIVLDAGAYSRLRAAGGSFDSSSPSGIYCTLAAGCTCPSGSPLAPVKFQHLAAGSYYLALGGGPSGNPWALKPLGLQEFCQQGTADTCLLGTWRLTALPPLKNLPANITIQKVDEVVTFTPDGVVRLQVDIVDSLQVHGAPPATGELKGPATIRVLAVGGVIQPQGADFSGWTVRVVIGGQQVNVPLSQFLQGIDTQLTPVSYRCAGGHLFLTNVEGTQFDFVKA